MKNKFPHLGKLTLYSLLSLGLLSPMAHAKAAELDKVIVTATKRPVLARTDANITRVITQEALAMTGATTVREALLQQTDISPVNAGGVRTLFMQGLGSNHTLVLVDGIPLRDPMATQGAMFLDAIAIQDVERIEIVSGGQGVYYGGSAMGGIVHIITHAREGKSGGSVQVSGGDSFQNAGVNYRLENGGSSLSLVANHLTDGRLSHLDDTQDRDELQRNNVAIQGKTQLGILELSAWHRYQDLSEEIDTFFGSVDDINAKSTATQYLSGAKIALNLHDDFETEVHYNHSRIDRSTQNPTDNIVTNNFSDTTYFGYTESIEWIGRFTPTDWFAWTIGLNNQREAGESDENFSGFKTGISQKRQDTRSRFSELAWHGEKNSLKLGGRIESYNRVGDSDLEATTYHVNYLRQFQSLNSQFRANYKSGFRLPSIYERFSSYGTESLKAEESDSHEFQWKSRFGRVDTGITYFNHVVDNRIGFNNTTFKYFNESDRLNSRGLTYNFALNNILWLNRMTVSYTRTNSETAGQVGNRIPREQWGVSLMKKWEAVQGRLTVKQRGEMRDNSVTLPSYAVANAHINVDVTPKVSFQLKVENITDADYTELNGYESLGRSFTVGTRVKI